MRTALPATPAAAARDAGDADWAAWLAGKLERPLVLLDGAGPAGFAAMGLAELARRVGLRRASALDLLTRPLPALFRPGATAGEMMEACAEALSLVRPLGDSFPRFWPNLGPGILAAFLGARVHPTRDTVWFDLDEPVELETWEARLDPANPWWILALELTRLASTAGGGLVPGFTDLGGNLDVLASLRGTERLLLDLVDRPEAVERASRLVTKAWLGSYEALWEAMAPAGRGSTCWAHVRSPGRCYMLQSDFSAMISPDMFARFVLPDLRACCAAIDHPFWHLDGKGEIPHLGLLLAEPRLRGIQWIPGEGAPPPEEWLPLLGRIIGAGKLCQLYVSPAGALKIVRALGGKGFALYVDRPMTPGQAARFLERVEKEAR